jgi:hypothetical protein
VEKGMGRKTFTTFVVIAGIVMPVLVLILLPYGRQMVKVSTAEILIVFVTSGVLVAGTIALRSWIGWDASAATSKRANRVRRIAVAILVIVGLARIAFTVLEWLLE